MLPDAKMKYHYQFVSETTVRIELIPEYKSEFALLETLSNQSADHEQLLEFFHKGLTAYQGDTMLTSTRFMNFPKVALCSFSYLPQQV